MRLLIKISVILIGCLLLSLVVLRNGIQPTVSHRMPLEVSWVSALATTLHYNLISGRDYYYTYGFISQILAYLAFILSGDKNAALSYSEIISLFHILNIVLLGVILTFYKKVFYIVLSFIFISFTNIFTSDAPLALAFLFRGLVLLLQAFVASRVLSSSDILLKRLGSLMFGVLSLVSQMITPELGLYSLASFILSSLILNIPALKFEFESIKKIIEPNFVMLAGYFSSNILLSIAFKLTSHYYINLFDYQFYSIQLLQGYVNTMGMAWSADLKTTLVLASITALTAIFLAVISRDADLRERSLPICLFSAALVYTRQATLRSDIGHILAGFVPMIVTFLLLINWLNKLYLKVTWFISAMLLVATLPLTSLHAYKDLAKFISAPKVYVEDNIDNILDSKIDALNQLNRYLDKKYILNFPSENYIGIMLDREIVTPVLLALGAHTTALQEYYIRMLEERKNEFNLTYSLDNISTGAVDRVQYVSRIPIIFEYLWQNYKLKTAQSFVDDGTYLLHLRDTPSPLLPNSVLQFNVREEGQQIVVDPQQTVQCPLVKIEMRITYPLYALLGRPNGIWAKFFDGNQLVHESGLVAIETNKSFYTYISLLDDKEFYTLFSDNPSPPKSWNRMVLSYRDTGFMGVNPSDLQIAKLYCVLGQNDD